MAKKPATSVKASRVVINSLADVEKLHKKEAAAKVTSRAELLRNAINITMPTSNGFAGDFTRTAIMRFLLDGPRDIDAECGYPEWLTPDHYRAMYDREGIAKRVVDCEPEESWSMDPEVYDNEDEKVDNTPFEEAWKQLVKDHNVWHHLQRIDVLSGIGQFGILLIGIDDGLELAEPVENCNLEDGTFDVGKLESKLLYLRPFDETVVFVKMREVEISSPRYGLPTMYTIQFRDFPNWGIQAGEIVNRDVHWSRVIHVADNRKMSEVYGIPRMQQVWNRLYDLRKIYSSSGEAFWKGAFPGLAFEVNPDLADQGVELDKDSIREEMEKFSSGMQRYMALTGVTTKTIPPMVVDPTPSVETHLKGIAIAKGIPYRVLFGSEEAKLAGDQDGRAWNKRLNKRQTKYLTPLVIRPFVDRMIDFGILPKPKEYFVDWPDLNAPSDQDKATVSLTKTQALQAYVQGGVSQLYPPDLFLTQIMGNTSEEKDAVLQGLQDSNDQFEQDGDQQDEDENGGTEGSLGNPTNPDGGNALDQKNLSRSTTAPPGAKQADPTLVQMPNLNQTHNFNPNHDQDGRFTSGDSTSGESKNEQGIGRSTESGRREPLRLPYGQGPQSPQSAKQDIGETQDYNQPLKGSEGSKTPIRPNPEVRELAKHYTAVHGLEYKPNTSYVAVDPDRGKRIADAFDAMKHAPDDPDVARSYAALKAETKAQYDAAVASGFKFEPWTGKGEPYKNSAEMQADVRDNKHMFFFLTDQGFGSSDSKFSGNPLLEQSGVTVNGKPLVYNDLFRGVHDLFGHAKDGVGFGPRGEENAWLSHSRMFSPTALPAMTTETRGQNSWVNFGPHGEANRAHPEKTIFADQKIGLLPSEFWKDPTTNSRGSRGGQKGGPPDPFELGRLAAASLPARK